MPDEREDGLGQSPKDPVTGRVGPHGGPLDRAGTEAERDARGDRAPPKSDDGTSARPGAEAGRDVERAAAYRENDA